MRARLTIGALALAATPACLGGGAVTRVVSGEVYEGRFISPEAYASVAEGALLEAQGDFAHAERAYRRASELDPGSAELWTRLGALACRARRAGARADFARAEALDDSYAPLARERARCARAEGHAKEALALAERAFSLDPLDEDTNLLLAALHDALGDHARAEALLRGLVSRSPRSRAGWRALGELAARRGDRITVREADARLRELESPRGPATALEVDRALGAGDLVAARRAARSAGMSASGLALRAVELGHASLALEQARLVLGADPGDPDARVAALLASELTRDPAGFIESLRGLTEARRAVGERAERLLGALLARRIGPDAERAWRDAGRDGPAE